MLDDSIISTIFLIFSGSAVLATLALYARQSLLVVYILLGIALGPSGAKLITDVSLIKDIGQVGIIFLLFLLGINLPISKLIELAGSTIKIAGISSSLFALIGFVVATIFGYSIADSTIIGLSMMFSSTIIGIKLLPTTVLHHKKTGEIIISILLLQDLIAIVALVVLQANQTGSSLIVDILLISVYFIGLISIAILAYKYIIIKLMTRFDRIQEYIFLLTIGWCLAIAEIAHSFHLSYEIGAFIAGVAIATSPIALFISEILKPLRDFFLILFFFSIGAIIDLKIAQHVIVAATILAAFSLLLKPYILRMLLQRAGENNKTATEIGFRLGQSSEFALLIAVLASNMQIISMKAMYLIQVSTLLTFIISSYLIVMKYPTPIAVSDKLRRD